MKSIVKRHIYPTHSEEWYNFRTVGIPGIYDGGIGASEVGVVLGIYPYEPTLMELYHHKVGSELPKKEYNNSMFWGLENEDKVAEIWQYWDGSGEGYMRNKIAGKKLRKMHRVNGYIVNEKYPWLFASLDRAIARNQVMLLVDKQGQLLDEEVPLECKNISYWNSRMWADGIPPYFFSQVNQQMLITDTRYCEIAILQDGRRFQVIPMERNDKICKRIVEQTFEFWQTVLRARKAFKEKRLAERAGKYEEAREHDAMIQQLEPMPDENEYYKEYLSEKFMKDLPNMTGKEEDLIRIRGALAINAIIKELKKRKSYLTNNVTNTMVKNAVARLDFGTNGYVTYTKKTGAKKFSLYSGVKPKPSEQFAVGEVNKMILNGNYF